MEILAISFVIILVFPILYVIGRWSNAPTVKPSILQVEGYEQLFVDIKYGLAKAKANANRARKELRLKRLLEELEAERRHLRSMARFGLEPWKTQAANALPKAEALIVQVGKELDGLNRWY